MEPLSNSVASALKIQPTLATLPVLNALLRDGLVVSGEVLETSAGLAYLSLGGRRVPAETSVELRPGQKFRARVQTGDGRIVLRLLEAPPEAGETLERALRSVLAQDEPQGALVAKLVADLVEHGEKLPAQERERLLAVVREIERFVFTPRTRAAGEAGSEPAISARVLKEALGGTGAFHEALIAGGGREAIELARADLKSWLWTALSRTTDATEKAILQRALDGIEAEQLLDVARRESGDARAIGLAVPDGPATATAFLVVHPDARREEADSEPEHERRLCVDLCVSFSRLGPVRAEFRLEGGRLGVRFVVADPEVAARIERDAGTLVEGLTASAPVASFAVLRAPPEAVDTALTPGDVRFLREHPLVDLVG